MKPFLIGCGLVAALCLLAVIGGGIYLVRKAMAMGRDFQAAAQQMQALETKFHFQPPVDGKMDPARFGNFTRARKSILAKMKAEPLFAMMAGGPQQTPPNFGPGDIFRSAGSMPRMIKDFAGELTAQSMSATEYQFYLEQSLIALRAAAHAGDAAVQQAWAGVEQSLAQSGGQVQYQNPGTTTTLGGIPPSSAANPNLGLNTAKILGPLNPGAIPAENIELVKLNLAEFADLANMVELDTMLAQFSVMSNAQNFAQGGMYGQPSAPIPPPPGPAQQPAQLTPVPTP